MMMKMLEAGGVPPLTDAERVADSDNPKGYYEWERVKKMPDGDTAWLADAAGKAVKVISALLKALPDDYDYDVIFMERALPEVLASQRKMLQNRGAEGDTVSDEQMATLYERHLVAIRGWLDEQPHMRTLYVSYNDMLEEAAPHIARINDFLGGSLDSPAMAAVIEPRLYRRRAP